MRPLPLLAAGLLAALPLLAPPPALAQSSDLDSMQQGISMLEASVGNQLQSIGVEADPQTLTLSQLATLHGILSGSDNDGTKAQRAQTVVGN